MLAIESVTLGYGKTAVVHDLSLTVADGEAVSLVGPNGAGKTTTLSAICGLVRPSRGTIRVQGREINGTATERLVREGIALVPEGRQIFATLTVAENLRLPTADVSREAAEELIEAELVRFPFLRERLDDPAGGLSGGQQQQLAIARALLCRPRLLLLDEPSLGLAPKLVDLVFETLADAARARGDDPAGRAERDPRRRVRRSDLRPQRRADGAHRHPRRARRTRERLTSSYLGGDRRGGDL